MRSTNETSTTAETAAPLPPVELSVPVPLAPDAAFRLFTAEITSWWPLATHSVAQERARRVVVEPAVGGRVFEVDDAGDEHEWGRILAWEPSRRFVMSWYPGRDAGSATEVEVSFAAESDGTRVTVIHSGWERLGERASETREGYAGGWQRVLGEHFRERAVAAAG